LTVSLEREHKQTNKVVGEDPELHDLLRKLVKKVDELFADSTE